MTPSCRPVLSFPRQTILSTLAVACLAFSTAHAATTENLVIGTYNIEADVNGDKTANPGLDSVIEAMGLQTVDGIEAPVDILGLEETTSNATTIAPIVSDLNSYYGAGTYAQSTVQGTEEGGDPSEGNGPNGIIYNTTAVTLISSVGVTGTPSTTGGAYRQVMRYEFEPVGGTAATAFYVYVTHSKSSASGNDSADQADRATEAALIRADEATLPANSSVIYMGDFNLDGSTETAYQTLTASGQGQAVDPLNTANNYTENWSSSTYKNIQTEADTGLAYRDDIEFMTSNVYNDTSASGLDYVSGSYRAFGNNGTTAEGKSVDLTSNTALQNVAGTTAYQESILDDLTTASDHLPVLADYTIAVPEPGVLSLLVCGLGLMGVIWRQQRKTSSI